MTKPNTPAPASASSTNTPTNTPSNKFSTRALAEVLEGVELGETAAALRKPDDGAHTLFARLAEAGEAVDALKLAAAALPKREAVWAAVRCVREAHGEDAPAEQGAALDAAQAWVDDPTDELRRAASDASEKAELDKPAGCVALAAFLSGGSLGPAEIAPIPPAEHLCGVAVGLALQIAIAVAAPERSATLAKRCLEIVRETADQPAPWDAPAKPAATPSTPANSPKAPPRTRR